MAQLWMSLTSGNSLLFTKQLLRWGLIRKCICLHLSFFLGKIWNCQAASQTWGWCLKEEQGRTHASRPGQGDFILDLFHQKWSFSLMPFESVLPLNWFIIDDVFWPYSDSFREPSFCFIWLDLDGWMAFNPLHDPKHLSMKGSSPAFFLAECLVLQKS